MGGDHHLQQVAPGFLKGTQIPVGKVVSSSSHLGGEGSTEDGQMACSGGLEILGNNQELPGSLHIRSVLHQLHGTGTAGPATE